MAFQPAPAPFLRHRQPLHCPKPLARKLVKALLNGRLSHEKETLGQGQPRIRLPVNGTPAILAGMTAFVLGGIAPARRRRMMAHPLLLKDFKMIPLHPKSKRVSLAFHLLLALALPCRGAWAESLREQLENLGTENHFSIEGLDRLGAEPSKDVQGDLGERIKALLSDYNFMSVGEGKKVERLNILSAKRHDPRPQISGTVKTQRLGSHHQVQATLSGPNNAEIGTSLLVDTGATTLVLPQSMIGTLGFVPGSLQSGMSQTAAGTVTTKTGMLKSVRVGDVVAENVMVSFIPDNKLNGARLLGMSFLNRFRFSLDDGNNELVLLSK